MHSVSSFPFFLLFYVSFCTCTCVYTCLYSCCLICGERKVHLGMRTFQAITDGLRALVCVLVTFMCRTTPPCKAVHFWFNACLLTSSKPSCTHTHIILCTKNVYTHTHRHTKNIYTHIHIHAHIHTYARTYIHTCIYTRACMNCE